MKKLLFSSLLAVPMLIDCINAPYSNLNYQPTQTNFSQKYKYKVLPTNPDLFKQIKAEYNIAKEIIDFWSLQVQEHALFLYLGLVDQKLKDKANEIHKELKNFRNEWLQNPGSNLANNILPLLRKERDFQIEVLDKLKSGKWLGWLYPTLIKHMTMELDYFVDKLNNIPYTKAKEATFWKTEAQERLGATAHLLDPTEKKLVSKANNIIKKYFNISTTNKEEFIESVLKAVKQANIFMKNVEVNSKNILSIISKKLADHELREGALGAKILEDIQS